MKKVKYYYNTRTLRYEKLVVPLYVKILRILGFIAAALVTSVIIVSIAYRFFDSPNEKRLRQEVNEMRDRYEALEGQFDIATVQLKELQNRDDQIYRAIFAAHPIPDSVRAGRQARQAEYAFLQNFRNEELISNAAGTLHEIVHRIDIQNHSYDELDKLVRNKQQMLAALPAIQPVANRNLTRIASGFGYRIDPIYKTVKYHTGLDFAAPTGTPVYATGDGKVSYAGRDNSGYGNHVIISHGYGYETLYAHMVRIKAKIGQHVKRGEVIGWVGSTGKSTGPHCHYEVIRNGNKVDPVYFFYNDLTPEQYERMLKIASSSNQSLD
ncbi:M23 family metallopeptidase [Compostibacter hankyongensis]|uniref:M23 family metallopeptidase n=1 Tax=Compostibacter hankyongensis TaxID=1007089 RepID=A0ABP8FDF1_9BACT